MDARGSRGVTYLELVATATIVLILASAILPLGRVAVKRQREIELRRALRELRGGIDRYQDGGRRRARSAAPTSRSATKATRRTSRRW